MTHTDHLDVLRRGRGEDNELIYSLALRAVIPGTTPAARRSRFALSVVQRIRGGESRQEIYEELGRALKQGIDQASSIPKFVPAGTGA
jgi:hypothetical protein